VDAAVRAYLHALNKAAYAREDVAESPEGPAAEKGSKELKGV
jgi:hypothetical protein